MLKVERVESVSKENGRTYNNYYIFGNIRGVDLRVEVIPPDAGGYKVLEVVYHGAKECELRVIDREFIDGTGKKIKSRSYQVVSGEYSETGEWKEFAADIMPKRKSDKALLAMLLD